MWLSIFLRTRALLVSSDMAVKQPDERVVVHRHKLVADRQLGEEVEAARMRAPSFRRRTIVPAAICGLREENVVLRDRVRRRHRRLHDVAEGGSRRAVRPRVPWAEEDELRAFLAEMQSGESATCKGVTAERQVGGGLAEEPRRERAGGLLGHGAAQFLESVVSATVPR